MSAIGHVKVVRGDELQVSGGQTEGMTRMNAITDMSDQLCSTGEYTHGRQRGAKSEGSDGIRMVVMTAKNGGHETEG